MHVADIAPHHLDRIASAHRRLDDHSTRIKDLELSAAGEAVRSRNIEKSLAEIQDGIKWVTRIVIGGIVAGALAFILQGGFNVGP